MKKEILARQIDLTLPRGKSCFLWGPRKAGKSYWICHHLKEAAMKRGAKKKKAGIKKKTAFGILKGGRLTEALEKSRRKEKQHGARGRIPVHAVVPVIARGRSPRSNLARLLRPS